MFLLAAARAEAQNARATPVPHHSMAGFGASYHIRTSGTKSATMRAEHSCPSTPMSKIDIRRAHALPLRQAKKQADIMAEHLGREFGLRSRWVQGRLHFERSGVEGVMTVTETEVQVQAELGFAVSLLRTTIERRLHSHFDTAFGADKAAGGKGSAARSTKAARSPVAAPKTTAARKTTAVRNTPAARSTTAAGKAPSRAKR